MSLLVNSPIISLTPLVNSLIDPVALLPVATQIMLQPDIIYYDPFRTYDTIIPGSLGYYVQYPDLNTDVKLQTKVLNKIWNKLESKWIFEYVKVFKFIVGSKNNYRLAKSLKEAEDNSVNAAEIEDKADWFLSNFYTKSNLASTIEKYRLKTNLDWWNVDEDIEHLKQFIYHQMRRKLFEKVA